MFFWRSFAHGFLTLALLGGVALPLRAQSTLTYQGQLFGANGAVDATYDMAFRLYDMPEGGEALWSESFENIPVVDGIFVVELGNQMALGAVARATHPLYLGIALGGRDEMSPRMLVGTALRAQWAAHALSLIHI